MCYLGEGTENKNKIPKDSICLSVWLLFFPHSRYCLFVPYLQVSENLPEPGNRVTGRVHSIGPQDVLKQIFLTFTSVHCTPVKTWDTSRNHFLQRHWDTATQQSHRTPYRAGEHSPEIPRGSQIRSRGKNTAESRYWEQGEGYCRKQRCLKVYPGERQTLHRNLRQCVDDFKYSQWQLLLPGRMLLPHLPVEKRVTALSVQRLFLHVSNHLEIELFVVLSLTFIFSLIMSQQNLIS